MSDPVYCPVLGDFYTPVPGRLPRVRLVRHRHRCPDGTWITVSAQYIAATGKTLYRWPGGGVTNAANPADEAPDWAGVDAAHAMVGAA